MLVGPMDCNPTAIGMDVLQPYLDQGIIEYYGETDDVREYMEQCSVFVLPSYREGTPKTNLEAMATGRPIITTDNPGCKETVQDGKTGFIYEGGNVDQLCACIERFLAMKNSERKKMGLLGREHVKENFSRNIVIDAYLTKIREILG